MDVGARIAAYQESAARAQVRAVESQYMYVRPLLGAANDLIDWMANIERRLMFGLPEIDAALRGIARGELAYLTGKAHAGKTQVVLHMVCANPELRILYFTPDEVDNLVVAKLVALVHGLNAEELERRVRSGDRRVHNLIRATTTDAFPQLAVVDQALSFDQMSVALHEHEDYWGGACDVVVVDYLDLLPGGADFNSTKTKSVHLKRWVKRHRVAGVCIHQPKRGGAWRGQTIGMDDLNQAGETEATFVLGVFRKREDAEADEMYRRTHRDTVSIHVDKNKRPPNHTGTYDYHLDPETGRIRQLRPEDFVVPGVPVPSASVAAAALSERIKPRRTVEDVIDLAHYRA